MSHCFEHKNSLNFFNSIILRDMLSFWIMGYISYSFCGRFGGCCGAVFGFEIRLKPFQTPSKTLQDSRSAQERPRRPNLPPPPTIPYIWVPFLINAGNVLYSGAPALASGSSGWLGRTGGSSGPQASASAFGSGEELARAGRG